jgi:hypothetical protein
MNMSVKNLNIARGLAVEKVGVNNLDLYIPRIHERYNEDEVKWMFQSMGIGTVDYVDFVATKDPETKEIKYYSAFMKLIEWNPNGLAYNNIMVQKNNKIQVSATEFWILLPAKTPLSRSKVNTHQLAAYTDELYVRVDAVEKKLTDSMTVSSEHFRTLLAKSEEQAKQIEQLVKIIQIQSEQLDRINNVLFEKQVEETENRRPRALTIEDLNPDQDDQNKCDNCSMKFDTEKQLYWHSSVCKKEAPLPAVCLPDDDDCFLSKPIVFHNFTETIDPKRDIIRGSFSVDLDDILGPVAKSLGITKEQAEKELEKEIANSKRAVSSRNYCGNE